MTDTAGKRDRAATGAARIIREIEARVRPTICPTYSCLGQRETLEGRITADDFDTLVTLAGAASFVQPGRPAGS